MKSISNLAFMAFILLLSMTDGGKCIENKNTPKLLCKLPYLACQNTSCCLPGQCGPDGFCRKTDLTD